MSTRALIGLGSNLGDRKALLDGAVAALAETPGVFVHRVSSYHETAPIGGPPGQGPFLNAAVALETTLPACELHQRLQAIEAAAGRARTTRWAARTLDLDLLLFGDLVLDTPELIIPHPRMAVRRFVLAPLSEIAPEAVEPCTRQRMIDLLAHLDRRPSYLALRRWWQTPAQNEQFHRVVHQLGAVGLSVRDWSPQPAENLYRMGPDPEVVLEQVAALLAPDRWTGLGDRWLVTDFSIRELALAAAEAWIEHEPDRFVTFLERLRKRESRVLAPTLVVCATPPSGGSRRPSGYTASGLPSLFVESADASARLDEILAACAATRT